MSEKWQSLLFQSKLFLKLVGWKNYIEGMHLEWPFSFSIDHMHTFAELSKDYNPLHSDFEFAKSKGFDAPLIHGLLLSSQMSRLIGQELPDQNAILTGIQLDFMQPSFPEDELVFEADLVTKSDSTYSLEFKCKISRDQQTLCRGLVSAIWRN
jgi:3-hydroxybutyryl-CoA dehydratase